MKSQEQTSSHFADRMAIARRHAFVGRAAELELLRQALQADEAPFAVLYIFGPGGVGKTTLLHTYAQIAAQHGRIVFRLDARDIDPSPQAFLLALSSQTGTGENWLSMEHLATLPPAVLFLDTYERLAPLDGWLRTTFLPALPAHLLVIIASRNPPAELWRTDPAWRNLARIVSLRNLRPEESRQLLTTLQVPAVLQEAVLNVAYGHPLALVLLADWLALGTARAEEFSLEHAPDVLHLLMERFLQDVPTPHHRQALEACALARVTTEALLAEVLGEEEAPSLFAWLRSLSFIETGPAGIFPHDLVREIVETDLRWRNPESWQQLYRRVRRYIVRRFWHSSGLARQQALSDLLFLQRHHPAMKPFYDWRTLGSAYQDVITPQDHPHILAMVAQHEGPESARVAAYWLERQPPAFVVFRGSEMQPLGFAANLLLETITPEDEQADPAARAIWAYVQRYGPPRPGERIQIARFWMGREDYQTPLTHNMVTLNTLITWLTTPNLAWTFCCMAEPAAWEGLFTYINFCRVVEADFTVGSRRYGGFAHNWRAEPLSVWNHVLAERQLDLHFRPEPVGQSASPLLVLSQPEFADAVRQALRDYHRPDALARNPLLRARVLRERAGPNPGPEALQSLLRAAAEALAATPKDAKLYRALYHTYVQPAPTQEAAAELLDLPFNTYRYHLSKGIERVTEWLWQRELYGPPAGQP
ncbi:AAA family ATPase [Kallotenue papyrolyticum]|uniref:AAA family ATPase n=1 Tax=Kallotenue papyrolyticum TaxID=1325125 RepID=UPI0004926C33|nr:AAA family ATPase [Kallotenue papyrolyticum]